MARHRRTDVYATSTNFLQTAQDDFEEAFKNSDASLIWQLCDQGFADIRLGTREFVETPLARAARFQQSELCEPLILCSARIEVFEDGQLQPCMAERNYIKARTTEIETQIAETLGALPPVLSHVVIDYLMSPFSD